MGTSRGRAGRIGGAAEAQHARSTGCEELGHGWPWPKRATGWRMEMWARCWCWVGLLTQRGSSPSQSKPWRCAQAGGAANSRVIGRVQVRTGRGFTHEELKEAGIPKKLAPTIGICVDHRRKNRSLETLQVNAARLKAYKASLVVFPRRSKKPKAGDATAEELQKADQCTTVLAPITKVAVPVEFVALTADMKVSPRASSGWSQPAAGSSRKDRGCVEGGVSRSKDGSCLLRYLSHTQGKGTACRPERIARPVCLRGTPAGRCRAHRDPRAAGKGAETDKGCRD
jgi:hypothetical protein